MRGCVDEIKTSHKSLVIESLRHYECELFLERPYPVACAMNEDSFDYSFEGLRPRWPQRGPNGPPSETLCRLLRPRNLEDMGSDFRIN